MFCFPKYFALLHLPLLKYLWFCKFCMIKWKVPHVVFWIDCSIRLPNCRKIYPSVWLGFLKLHLTFWERLHLELKPSRIYSKLISIPLPSRIQFDRFINNLNFYVLYIIVLNMLTVLWATVLPSYKVKVDLNFSLFC